MNNKKVMAPQRLKGFSDFFADDMKIRDYVINIFKQTFEKYGYEPLETPSLEYTELMLGNSGEEAEKQFYRFQDPGGRDVMLKYEVMTSMCRAVAQNINNIPMPYKRYQIQRVWRAENTQKGRYREFTQCDADTIGSDSMIADGEFIQMGLEIVGKLGFQNYFAKISNRKFLEGLREYVGIEEEKYYGFFMSIDKLPKIGKDKVIEEMVERREIEKEKALKALELIDPANYEGMSFREKVNKLLETVGTTEQGKEGLNELLQIADYLETAKVDEKLYRFDTTIARGLASYTGPVWEFEVVDGGVGSIAGCGRYDKLIERYIGKEIPATGGSFGIERVCDIIKDRNMLDLGTTTTDVMVTIFNEELTGKSIEIANYLRDNGIKTMIYPEAAGLKNQFSYASKKGIPWVIVLGPDEVEKDVVVLKNMKEAKQEVIKMEEVVERVK